MEQGTDFTSVERGGSVLTPIQEQKLLCFAKGHIRPLALAEEMWHDALTTAWEKQGELKNPAKALSWCIGILLNLYLGRIRTEKRRAARERRVAEAHDPSRSYADQKAADLHADLMYILWRYLPALIRLEQDVLRYWAIGLTWEQISEKVGRSVPTVKKYFKVAKYKLNQFREMEE